jgi:gas vesicle protein
MKAVEAQDKIDEAIARQKEAQQKLNDLLMGASEDDAAEQYEIYAKNLSDANENLAKVVDESMGDLARGIKNSGDDFADSTEDVMDDIKSLIPGPTDAEMKAVEAQDKIDEAIAKQKEAQEKLASISEDDEDFLDKYEMAAQELNEANENLSKVVEDSMGDLARGIKNSGDDYADNTADTMDDINSVLASSEWKGQTDEFGGMESPKAEWQGQTDEFGGMESPKAEWQGQTDEFGGMESPKAEWKGQTDEFGGMESPAVQPKDTLDRSKISFGKVTGIGKNGMPILAEPKKDDKNLPKVENPDDARENAKFKRQAEESKKAADTKTAADAGKGGDAKSGQKTESKSLDDVVKTLEKLNTAMEKLIAVNNSNSTLLKDQIKATKSVASAASGNLHGAH